MALCHGRVFTNWLRFVRFGRISEYCDSRPRFRCWLLAEVRTSANSFRFGMNSGSRSVRFRLSIALASPFVRPSTVRSVRRV